MLSRNLNKLPDAFKKTEDSNNNKMLLMQEHAIDDFLKDMEDLEESLDIWKAYGKTLDLYGDIVGQKRGAMNDDMYRYIILTKISANMTQADESSVISNIFKMFNISEQNKGSIVITESDEPCTLKLTRLPLETLLSAGFTSKQAVEMIKSVLPAGVSIIAENFEGTFEFSATADEYDENAGFADDKQTIGGYLGLLYGESDEKVLPI